MLRNLYTHILLFFDSLELILNIKLDIIVQCNLMDLKIFLNLLMLYFLLWVIIHVLKCI